MIAFYYIGLLLCIVGGIWLLITAFSESILWGLGSLFVPFVSLIFAVTHWEKAKTPFLVNVAGAVLLFMGYGAMKSQIAAG